MNGQDILLERLLRERPQFHRGETEVRGSVAPAAMTILRADEQRAIESGAPFAMGIDAATARFIYARVQPSSVTLETGSGISTLLFAMKGSEHFAITPNANEAEAIAHYASAHGIDVSKVRFVAEASERALPSLDTPPLDLVLVDGKHAFPWPILDWFFTAERLKVGGVVILDDTQLWAVQVLVKFLAADAGAWRPVNRTRKAAAFEKTAESVHNVAWYMQPFADSMRQRVMRAMPSALLKIARRVRG
jgi:predicted O-methyltransferase YrrM